MTSYSVFWDFSTTPLWSDFPLIDLVLNWEDKFYPDTKPVRSDCVIFLDSSLDSEASIGKLGSSLKACGFKLIEYTYRESNADVVRRSQQYLKKSEVTDLIFISGKHDFFLKIYYASQMSSTKFNLITADKYVKRFEWANKVLMFEEIILDTLDKTSSETDHDHPWSIKCPDNKDKKVDEEDIKFKEDGKDVNKQDASSKLPTSKKMEVPPEKFGEDDGKEDLESHDDGEDVNKPDALSTLPTKLTSEKENVFAEKFEEDVGKEDHKSPDDDEDVNKPDASSISPTPEKGDVFGETFGKDNKNKKLRYVCLLSFDSVQEDKLMKTFEPCLEAFKGRLITCWKGVCVLEFRSKLHLTTAEPFLSSLYPICGLQMNSITVLDKITGETLDLIRGEKVSNQTYKKKSSEKLSTKNTESYSDRDQVSESDGDKNYIGNKIWTAKSKPKPKLKPKTKPNTNSSSRDDDPQKPRSWDFLKNGYFLTFTNFLKDGRPSWYRKQIYKLLGNITAKFIYLDPKSDWAMIQFNSEDDQNAAQKVLRGAKFPGKSFVLNPDRTSTISSYHINRIKFFFKYPDFNKITITEKRCDDECLCN